MGSAVETVKQTAQTNKVILALEAAGKNIAAAIGGPQGKSLADSVMSLLFTGLDAVADAGIASIPAVGGVLSKFADPLLSGLASEVEGKTQSFIDSELQKLASLGSPTDAAEAKAEIQKRAQLRAAMRDPNPAVAIPARQQFAAASKPTPAPVAAPAAK